MAKITVSLVYPPQMTEKPVISELVRDFNITFSILRAEVQPGRGRLTLALTGGAEDLQKGLTYLENQGIQVSVLNRNIIWNSDKCVDCGACTGVCGTGALRLDDAGHLRFDNSRCIACELCLRVCPLHAMDVDLFGEKTGE